MHEELVNHVTKRLTEASRTEEPIPHIVVRDVFPDYFYELLESNWPDYSLFDRKGDIRPDRFYALDARTKDTWGLVSKILIPEAIAPQLMQIFKPEIDAQLAFISNLDLSKRDTSRLGASGIDASNPKPNRGRFMARPPGFRFLPHVDPIPYVVTLLLYVPYPEQIEGCGTILYKADKPIPTEFGNYKLFGDYKIPVVEVTRVPYTPNTLFAFPNNRLSSHGLQIPKSEKRIRRSFQAHISVKAGNDEETL